MEAHPSPPLQRLPEDWIQHHPVAPDSVPLDLSNGAAEFVDSLNPAVPAVKIETDVEDELSLAAGVANRRRVDESSLRKFVESTRESADGDRSMMTPVVSCFAIPLIFFALLSFVLFILSCVFPGGGVSGDVRVSWTVCCVFVFVASVCGAGCCCAFSMSLSRCCPCDAEDSGEKSTGAAYFRFLTVRLGTGLGGGCGILLLVLFLCPVTILSVVLGVMAVPLATSAIPWVVFLLSLVIGLVLTVGLVFACIYLCILCSMCSAWGPACASNDCIKCFLKFPMKSLGILTCGISETCLKKASIRQTLQRSPCTKAIAQKFVHEHCQIGSDWFADVNCYCRRCWALGNFENSLTRAGQKYAVPRLWTEFLLPPIRCSRMKGIENWHIAYHGTTSPSAKAIIETQRMLMPGDRRPDGGVIGIRPGHITGDEDFVKRVFMSPSATYVSCPVYGTPYKFLDPASGKECRILLALQLYVQPGKYEVGPETIGAREWSIEIDPLFPNDELEWFTNRRGVIEIKGLMAKVVFVQEEKEDAEALRSEEEKNQEIEMSKQRMARVMAEATS